MSRPQPKNQLTFLLKRGTKQLHSTLSIFCVLVLTFQSLSAQDDIWKEIDKTDTLNDAEAAFKSLKIVNFESTKLAAAKEFRFVVSHRFGSVKNGIDDFFGLDNAVTRIQFIYGISDKFNIGISRSSFQKVYDIQFKYRLLTQREGGFPVTVSGYSVGGINTSYDEDLDPAISFGDKLSYVQQILISRKFNDRLSLELAPSYLYEAYPSPLVQHENQFVMGMGGRYKIANRWSINMDYGIHTNRTPSSPFHNPLSIGVDLETGGHVFQMHFTNAEGMMERGFLSHASGDWGDGDFFFGFNLTRTF
ncbi:hypothetical protein SAMN04487906_2020 [Zhouia amylolytica]|uniref:DUF5777 domain-containing protein n=1 Tax=Zhouia amylolytica TaxID=376730 RepID=A0A1I6TFF1_9FLAO|nr:DUF5777 family beta-barrel protein [Zhouia amylolytica]SFS87895.1 hypothetical protein SAMN04487906_2020 [Zhouia amylolytica]